MGKKHPKPIFYELIRSLIKDLVRGGSTNKKMKYSDGRIWIMSRAKRETLRYSGAGISVIEILVVIAILLIAFVGILGLLTFSLQTLSLIKETTSANFLAQETIESVRNFRDGTDWATNGLGTLTVGVSYHPEKTADIPAKWILAEGEETIGNFTRKIILENVQRDGNDNIVEEGGTNDPDTNKIKITVSWKDKKVEVITYLTNWKQ